MSIRYIEDTRQLILETKNTAYQMKIDELGYLQHLYYGPKLGQNDMSYPFRIYDHGFSGNPYDMRQNRAYSLDSMAQEYTSFGVGDFRVTSIRASCSDGSRCAEFRYESHEIQDGKYAIPGLPSVYDSGQIAQTLIVTLIDNAANIRIKLYYGVFEELDVITRAAEIINAGYEIVWLRKACSMCLELPFGKWDMIHFHGRHCMERQAERVPLFHGVQTISSRQTLHGAPGRARTALPRRSDDLLWQRHVQPPAQSLRHSLRQRSHRGQRRLLRRDADVLGQSQD